MNLNVVLVAGRLTDDPQIMYTPTGKAKGTFAVAVNEGYGERRSTEFIECEAWEKQAEKLDVARKGSVVVVQGRWNKQSWKNKEGQNRTKVVVKVGNLQVVQREEGERSDRSGDQGPQETDDIPF